MKPFKTNGLIAPGSIPRSLLRTFNFEIWKLKCLGACPEDLYSMKGFTTAMTPNRSRVDTTSRYHQEVKTMNTKQGKFSSLWPRELRKGSALIVTLVIGIGLLSVIGVSLRWGVTEKRLNIQHIRRQQAKNASESLVEYGFAELVARFTGQTSFPSDELEQRPLARLPRPIRASTQAPISPWQAEMPRSWEVKLHRASRSILIPTTRRTNSTPCVGNSSWSGKSRFTQRRPLFPMVSALH